MPVEAVTPLALFTVSGIGPYEIPFSYAAGAVYLALEAEGITINLAGPDFAVTPEDSDTTGDVFLAATLAAQYEGARLVVSRQGNDEQGWQSTQGGKERALELQLDAMVRADQELRAGLAGALRVAGSIDPLIIEADRALVFTATGVAAGPSLADVAGAGSNAATAQLAADLAQAAAATFIYPSRQFAIEGERDALFRAQDFALAFMPQLAAGAYGDKYPVVYPVPIIGRPVQTARYLANREIVFKRIAQITDISWTPLVVMPGQRGPTVHQPGTTYAGPPYGSVKTLGRTIGQDVSLETFLSSVSNPDSIWYQDFTALPGHFPVGTGYLYYGAVCSNFLARGFGWLYSPTTRILDLQWRQYGFVSKATDGSFRASDMEVGDVVNSVGGGHIEIVLAKDATTITMLDQGFDGPDIQVFSTVEVDGISPATAYFRSRGYALLVFDYNAGDVDLTYTPDPFSPLAGESLPPAVINTFVKINRGNKSNYTPGEAVRFNVVSTDVSALVITRAGVPIETIPTAGAEIITRTFAEVGDYTAHCVRIDTSLSPAEQFNVASVAATASTATIAQGREVTVDFTTANCTAGAIIVQDAITLSLNDGLLRYLTPLEIEAGTVRFNASFDKGQSYHIRIRATNDFGAVFNEPMAGLLLAVT